MISEYLNYSCFSTTPVDLETLAPSKPWYTLKLFGNWKPSGRISAYQCRRYGFDPWVWSLGWEDSLEKETATYFSVLAWKILWIFLLGYNSWVHKRVGHDLVTKLPPPMKTKVNFFLDKKILRSIYTNFPAEGSKSSWNRFQNPATFLYHILKIFLKIFRIRVM